GGKNAQHASQPDLAGIDLDADFSKVRAIRLLREFCARGAGSDLTIGVDAFWTDEVREGPGLTSSFNPPVAEAGRIGVHASELRQLCSQLIAGVEQGRARTGCAVRTTRTCCLRKVRIAQFHSNSFGRQAEHFSCD